MKAQATALDFWRGVVWAHSLYIMHHSVWDFTSCPGHRVVTGNAEYAAPVDESSVGVPPGLQSLGRESLGGLMNVTESTTATRRASWSRPRSWAISSRAPATMRPRWRATRALAAPPRSSKVRACTISCGIAGRQRPSYGGGCLMECCSGHGHMGHADLTAVAPRQPRRIPWPAPKGFGSKAAGTSA